MNDKQHADALPMQLLGAVLLTLSTTSCLAIGMSEHTQFEEAQRTMVKFPSSKAAQDFEAGLRASDRDSYVEQDTFALPLIAIRRKEVYHETAHYNAEVRKADVNRDGEVTEAEARSYLAAVQLAVAGK